MTSSDRDQPNADTPPTSAVRPAAPAGADVNTAGGPAVTSSLLDKSPPIVDSSIQSMLIGDTINVYQGIAPVPVAPDPLAAANTLLATMPLDRLPEPAATLPPGSRMPFARNPLFVGRAPDLLALATALKHGDTAAIGSIAAATGLGGIGKTQLAAEFAHRYGQFFAGGVFWLSFADPEAVPAEIAASGGLGLIEHPSYGALKLEEQLRLVLAAWQSALPRLLIFDNCEDETLLARWRPPTGGCRVLLTSRRREWDAGLGVLPLPLGVLPRAESIALLRQFLDSPPLPRTGRGGRGVRATSPRPPPSWAICRWRCIWPAGSSSNSATISRPPTTWPSCAAARCSSTSRSRAST
jgi:hypothetical protein